MAKERAAKMEEERKAADRLRERELHKQIDNFMLDQSKTKLEFSKTLNSWERQVIHAYCETIKIKHESQGNENQRFIVISKPFKI